MAVAVQSTVTTLGSPATGTATFTANYPSGVVQGDLLIMSVASWITLTATAPTGWTALTPATLEYHRTAVFWREAPASPGTTVAVPYTSTGNQIIVNITRITGHRPGNPIDSSANNTGPNRPMDAPSLTPSGTGHLSLLAGSWVTGTTAPATVPAATGYTSQASGETGNLKASVASRVLATAAATGTVDYNFGTDNIYAHTHVLVAPLTALPITMAVLASTAVVSAPAAALYDRFIAPDPIASTVVPTQHIQRGDAFITMAEWAVTGSGGLNQRSPSPYRPLTTAYRPVSLVNGTRLFAPSMVPGSISFSTVTIPTGAVLFDHSVVIADISLVFAAITSTVMGTPGIYFGQSLDLGALTQPVDPATLFAPAVLPGDAFIAPETFSSTVVYAIVGFDVSLSVPYIEPTTVLYSPIGGYEITVGHIASTVVFTPLIGSYAVLAEPDIVFWGASGGYSARIDILDAGGDVIASTANVASGIVLVSGKVSEDYTQPVARECSVRLLLENTPDGRRHPLLPAKPGDPLDPRSGGSLEIYAGPIKPSGTPALVRLGVFHITAASPTSSATGDSLSIRGLSEEVMISQTPFFDVFNVVAGTSISKVIGNMVIEAIPDVMLHLETTTVTSPEFSFSDSDNRLTKVRELAAVIGMDPHFDRRGWFRLEHMAEYGDAAYTSPRWTFTEGKQAVMRDVSRELDDTELYNGVIVVGEPRDSNTDPVRAQLWDTNIASPMYYNPNSPGASKMGPRPKKYVTPLVYTVDQARALAVVMLTRLLAWPDRISVTIAANPNIESGDLARVVRTTMGVDGLYEIQSIDHDLLGGASTAVCVARN